MGFTWDSSNFTIKYSPETNGMWPYILTIKDRKYGLDDKDLIDMDATVVTVI